MYKRILVPVDGSRTAAGALHEACRLAREQHALLRLIHVREASVVEGALRMGAVAGGRDSERVAALSGLQQAIDGEGREILRRGTEAAVAGGVKAETALLDAMGRRPAEVILAEARRWKADLIVLGTHGRTGLRRLVFGSVAEGVLRKAHVPVLLLRRR